MTDLAGMPQTPEAASAHLFSVTNPTLADLKLMVMLEAAGQGFYDGLAAAAPSDAVKELLARNGQEELAHAHRVSRVIGLVHGEEFAVPAPAENPFYLVPQGLALNAGLLGMIIHGEDSGEALYENWAKSLDNDEAARLLRQNGKEETRHAERARQAMALLDA